MAVNSRAVSVTTTATRLDTVNETDDNYGQSVVVYNNGASTVYVGPAGVTTATGSPVAPGAWSPGLDIGPSDALYGIVASGTVEVRVLEVGV